MAIGSQVIDSIHDIPAGVYILTLNAQAIGTSNGRYDLYVFINGDHTKSFGSNTFHNNQAYPLVNISCVLVFDATSYLQITSFCTAGYTLNAYDYMLVKLK